jgi:hypothetical protein
VIWCYVICDMVYSVWCYVIWCMVLCDMVYGVM